MDWWPPEYKHTRPGMEQKNKKQNAVVQCQTMDAARSANENKQCSPLPPRLVVVAKPMLKHVIERADGLVVVAERRRPDLGLLCVGVEALDVARRHGAAQGRQVDGALLPLGYRVGRGILLLPLPQEVLP